MTLSKGFVAALPQEKRRAYRDHSREALSLFKDHGAARMVENWSDDVLVVTGRGNCAAEAPRFI